MRKILPVLVVLAMACGDDIPTDPEPRVTVQHGQLTGPAPITMPAGAVQVDGEPHPYRLERITHGCEPAGSMPGTEAARTITGIPGPRDDSQTTLDIIAEGHGDVGTVLCRWDDGYEDTPPFILRVEW